MPRPAREKGKDRTPSAEEGATPPAGDRRLPLLDKVRPKPDGTLILPDRDEDDQQS